MRLTQLYCLLFILFAISTSSPVFAEATADFMSMELEQLMQVDVTVTSVSKSPQRLSDTASAIYVVTQEDIRRTGVTNIPEALRMVPGVDVVQKTRGDYEVNIRGLGYSNVGASAGGNKLLVLVDGRSIYSPVYGGVIWQATQDMMMEDIDRIEVIRGPGGALWGSNAVAGVINIITKSTKETQGGLVSAMGGTSEYGAVARWGDKADDNFTYRVYGKYRDQNPGLNSNGSNAYDGRNLSQGGFRGEWQGEKNLYTIQGDVQQANVQADFTSEVVSYSPPYNSSIHKSFPYTGGNILGRWDRKLDDGGSLKFQMYYDATRWHVFNSGVYALDAVDLEFQHNFKLWDWNSIAWGLNFRNSELNVEQTINTDMPHQDLTLASFFVHDEITILPTTLSVILGSKFEHNSITGMETQPNVRTVWTPHPDHTFWAAVSRAVRLPEMVTQNNSRFSVEGWSAGYCAPSNRCIFQSVGIGGLKPETLLAYEVGYRLNAIPKKLSFDLALFNDYYRNLIASSSLHYFVTPLPSYTLLQAPWENDFAMKVYGGELSGEWKVLDNWRLTGSYAYKYSRFYPTGSQVYATFADSVRLAPHFSIKGRSYLELPHNLEFDTTLSYQDQYQYFTVPAYAQLDLRLGWKATRQLEVSLVGQNLIRAHHPEIFPDPQAVPPDVNSSETPRAFLGKLTWRF